MRKPTYIQLSNLCIMGVDKDEKVVKFSKINYDGSTYFFTLNSKNTKKLSEQLMRMHKYLESLK